MTAWAPGSEGPPGSELVRDADVIIAAVALIVDHLTDVVVLIGDERTVGQILRLGEDREALEETLLEFVADLRVEDAFRLCRAVGRRGRKARDFGEEVRPVAIVDARLEAILFEVQRAAGDHVRQAWQRDRRRIVAIDDPRVVARYDLLLRRRQAAEQAREVIRIGIVRIDEVGEVLEVARQSDIAAAVEILFQRDVDVGRLVRPQRDVTAVRREHRIQRRIGVVRLDVGKVDRHILGHALLVETRTDHRLRRTQLDVAAVDQLDREGRRGQDVGVGRLLVGRRDRHDAVVDAGDLAGAALLAADDLHAERALHRLAAKFAVDVRLGVAGPDVFGHDIVADQRRRTTVERLVERVVVDVQRVPGQHRRDAEIGQRDIGAEQRGGGQRCGQRGTAGDGAVGAAAGRAEEVGGVGAGLFTTAVVAADFPALNDAAVDIALQRGAQRLQVVAELRLVEEARLDDRLRAVVAPALRVGQLEDAGVGVIQRRHDLVSAIGVLRHGYAIGDAALRKAGAGVSFEQEVGAVRAAPAGIDVEVQVVGDLEIVVPAERQILCSALVIVVALHGEDVAERRRGGEAVVRRDAALDGIREAEREFDAAQALFFGEVRIERVEGRVEILRRGPFDRRDRAIAAQFVRLDIGLGATQHIGIGGGAAARIAPGVVAFVLRGRLRRRHADRDAERVVGELVDVGCRGAIAVARRIRVQIVDAVHLAARIDREDALRLIERAQHAQTLTLRKNSDGY
ncbi:hypothetical protein WR25_25773 [Diploscapter pachys]|uniref:Uncharacterized protein n=1 Tax=Diploscapter pachys TaxID=2018661 RepID=A0A2A2JWH2_9BILA|nr:hypothetical protein WR25_25773 [Diploscapter pachys]